MSKHTPGPWVAGWSIYDDNAFIVQAGSPSRRVLARFDGDGDGPDAQSKADARLIAAAPEMLSALEQITRTGYSDIGDRLMVEAVIAKATGEST